MRVLVTGADGFVGRWMVEELREAGYEVIGTPPRDELDIVDGDAVRSFIADVTPDAVVHLAGLAFGPDATRDTSEAERVNVTGTATLLNALATSPRSPAAVVVAGSADVYGRPDPEDLPLQESATLGPATDYGRSKLRQEETALAIGRDSGIPLVTTRSFNHTGPGQRAEFVAPALARRILAAAAAGSLDIPVGNLDVRRDMSDVRDVVRAYRLILDCLANGRMRPGTVVNVASGRSVSIREIVAMLSDIVGVTVTPRVDPALVRVHEPLELVGDATLLHELTGWEPRIPLRRTLEDLVASLR
jgi:GDP-4-dehydro-6-deoxy-D-mannose reductase